MIDIHNQGTSTFVTEPDGTVCLKGVSYFELAHLWGAPEWSEKKLIAYAEYLATAIESDGEQNPEPSEEWLNMD